MSAFIGNIRFFLAHQQPTGETASDKHNGNCCHWGTHARYCKSVYRRACRRDSVTISQIQTVIIFPGPRAIALLSTMVHTAVQGGKTETNAVWLKDASVCVNTPSPYRWNLLLMVFLFNFVSFDQRASPQFGCFMAALLFPNCIPRGIIRKISNLKQSRPIWVWCFVGIKERTDAEVEIRVRSQINLRKPLLQKEGDFQLSCDFETSGFPEIKKISPGIFWRKVNSKVNSQYSVLGFQNAKTVLLFQNWVCKATFIAFDSATVRGVRRLVSVGCSKRTRYVQHRVSFRHSIS